MFKRSPRHDLIQGVLIPRAAEADQVIAQAPADAFGKFLQHHTVEAAEQQGSVALGPQAERLAEIADLAAGEVDANGIKLQQCRVGQQLPHLEAPERAQLLGPFQDSFRGSCPGDGIDGDRNVELVGETAEGLTGQQLAVAVADQQQSKWLAHATSASSVLIRR